MMKNKIFVTIASLLLCSCTLFSDGSGQVVFHWEKTRTGVEKFSRDHAECLLVSKEFKLFPDFRTWFYAEETKLDTRADWNSEKGIWASYVPYPGAQPLIVNSRYDDEDISPAAYSDCMIDKGYWHREHTIPEITNINLYDYNKYYRN
ncbi:MAG: hypothetical protein E7018_06730 [Alphaproteobacteria bacterium]|nr:hypothetical protein [Alphaproteobacteria bacterium]